MAVNWSQDAESVITSALGEIPEIGSLLSGLVEIFWPQSGEDVWDEIKSAVQRLIDQAISTDDYNRVLAVLGSAQGTGLIGDIDNYLGAVDNTNGQNLEETWTAANQVFIDGSGQFQQSGDEILLLPLFAQMANLHLTLLRDGVLKGFCYASELQGKIEFYQGWAINWSAQAVSNSSAKHPNQFNSINQVTRFMQINVGNFARLWPYFNPGKYPPPVVDIPVGPELFYTISELQPSNWTANTLGYSPRGTLSGNVSEIDVYSVNSDEGDWIMLGGVDVKYDAGGATGYTGVTVNGETPPVGQDIYDVGVYSITKTSADQKNPIVQVDGNFSADPYIRYIRFTFKDNSQTGNIPSNVDNCQDSNFNFTITPPAGYHLTSVWAPGMVAFYNAARDLVFGFQGDGSLSPSV